MQNQKKITFLISTLGGGGAEGVCVNVANKLAEIGWKVDLIVLHLNNATYLNRVSDKVNLIVLGADHARMALLPLLKHVYNNSNQQYLVFNYELTILLVLIRGLFGFKIYITARNINNFTKANKLGRLSIYHRFIRFLIKTLYARADHFINQCVSMEQDLLENFPKLKGKTSVIYNPVSNSIEEYVRNTEQLGVAKKDYFLCVGRLEEQKAFHIAIQSFAYFSSDNPDYRLKIIGEGSLKERLVVCAEELGVASKIDFEGFQKDVIPYYLEAQATLLTSLYEGFPNTLVESITLGTPVIAVNCSSGPSEIIVPFKNGILLGENDKLGEVLRSFSNHKFDISVVKSTANKYSSGVVIQQYSERLSHNQ